MGRTSTTTGHSLRLVVIEVAACRRIGFILFLSTVSLTPYSQFADILLGALNSKSGRRYAVADFTHKIE